MKENPPTDQSPGLVKNDTRRQLAKLNSPWFIWPATGVLAVLLFGGKKVGELGKGLGEGIRNFKTALKGDEEKVEEKKQA